VAEAARPVLSPVRRTFRAVARTVVPETASLDETGWTRLESIVEQALAERPARMRRQLVVFIRLIDWMAVPRHGRRFAALGAEAREALLHRLQDSPVLLLRRGFWGLRTLVFMGWYAQPATAEHIGYAAHLRGWTGRPGITPREPLPSVAPAHEVGSLP
jgi:hypothetical protein